VAKLSKLDARCIENVKIEIVMFIHNDEKLAGPHAGLGFDTAIVETFSSAGETTG